MDALKNIDENGLSNKEYDLLIYGATPAGITCALRAARDGLYVLLVNYYPHIGGMLINGIGVWDTLYEGGRSPIYDELRQSIFKYYRNKYGSNSDQFKDALPGKTGHTNGTFEPKVVECLIKKLISNEENLDLLTEFYPNNAEVEENLVQSIEFFNTTNDNKVYLKARFYIDCTYEGDMLPLIGLPFRLGRESRYEYNEPHAGKIFIRNLNDIKYDKGIDLRQFGAHQAIIYPESTGESDNNIQAFNLRTILTSDPGNKIEITKPYDYDPNIVRELDYDSVIKLPNNKICWNRPQLVGILQKQYIEGDWETRKEVVNKYKKAVICLLYFLQNDSSVPADDKNYWKNFGLPKDEFIDNNHLPYEIYVREGRRLVGEDIITQYDLMPDLGQQRTPVKYDSIGVTDWYMDSHACTNERTRDSLREGTMMLYYDTYPGQIPFSSLYNKKIKNFLTPVCLSSTHVAWNAIRLEATWMNIAESAACAVAMSIQENKWLDTIDIDRLQLTLVEKRIMIGFFNKFDIQSDSPLIPAAQYFSAKGFFKDYHYESDDFIVEHTAVMWVEKCRSIIDKANNTDSIKSKLQNNSTSYISANDFNKIMNNKGLEENIKIASEKLTKGQVIMFLYDLIKSKKTGI